MERRLPDGLTTEQVSSAPSLTSSSLLPRAISGTVLGAWAIASVLGGVPWYQIMVVAGGSLMAWEWGRMCGGGRHGFGGAAMTVTTMGIGVLGAFALFWPALILGAASMVIVYVLTRSFDEPSPPWQASGVLWVGSAVTAMHFVFHADPVYGLFSAGWVMATAFFSDIGAYFGGRWIGGPKLAPRISPAKTWAGLAGGILTATAVSVAIAWAIHPQFIWLALIGGPVLAAMGLAGDLFESHAKRQFRVKDSAGIIPGHGGALDRFDGLSAAMILAALVALANGGSLWIWK